jgi:hypothetical protein
MSLCTTAVLAWSAGVLVLVGGEGGVGVKDEDVVGVVCD